MIDNYNIENAILHLSKNDKIIYTLIKKNSKCNLTHRKQYFHSLLRSIIGQQLSVASARAIIIKVFNHFENKPTPEKILETDDKSLRALGLSNAKMKYVKDLSAKIYNKELSFRGIAKLSNNEVIEKLTLVKGIGVWTSHMFLMFTLGRLNVLPVGDLGIKKAIMVNYGLENLPSEEDVEYISQKYNWAPYESVASWYLWKSIDQ